MKRTSNLKKTLALFLALVMSLSLCITAMAANVTLSIPDEGLSLQPITDETLPSGVDYYYEVDCPSNPTYHPANFSLLVNATGSYTVEAFENARATQEGTTNPNYWLIIPSSSGESYVNITCGNEVYRIKLEVPNSGNVPTGTGIYAYLPAPGQFTNEGVTTGGWGDAYNSNGQLKGMVGEIATTGVSLGYFGGYVVFYMGDEGIKNDPSHPYGVDFIVYGNAFWNNSEPGCIQVSKNGTDWYDIAGSLYYNENTIRNTQITYENPNVTEDAGIKAAGSNLGSLAAVTYTGSKSGTITTNPFHRHSWFPLNANYFVGRYKNPELAKVGELPFVSQTLEDGVTKTLTMNGVLLGGITVTNNTANLGFGYCDVHPNNSGNISVAYNPYQEFEEDPNGTDYNTKTAGTGGGDPIDLAWAVDENGNPHNFGANEVVRYVRIYTGPAAMNGMFGEISTEVCGIAAVTGTGSGAATVAPTVLADKTLEPTTSIAVSNLGVSDVAIGAARGYIKISSTADHLYVNGESFVSGDTLTLTGLTTSTSQKVQIITQTGTEAPYITVLNVHR